MNVNKRTLAMLVAEAVGTFGLTLAVLSINRYAIPFFTAIVAGVTIATFMGVFMAVSGGHFNPAVTAAMLTMRRIPVVQAVGYVLVQAVGAVGAWKLYEYFVGQKLTNQTGVFEWKVFLAEMVGAAVFTMGVATAVNRFTDAWQRATIVGSAFFIGATMASLASQALLNPAVSLGARMFSYEYVFGPLVGGVVGAGLYTLLFTETVARRATPAASSRTTTRAKSTARRGRPAKRR